MSLISNLNLNTLDTKKVLYTTLAILGTTLLFFGKRYFNGPACKLTRNLTGKIAIVTGANTGIGKETAKQLVFMGAHVVIAARDKNKGKLAVEQIISSTKNQNVEFMKVDLSDLESVRKFAEEYKNKYQHLHILINNAGIMSLPKQEYTKDGIECNLV